MRSKGRGRRRPNVRSMTLTALMTALLCVVAPISIPIGTVPLSLSSLIVLLCAAVLGARRGMCAVLLYICIGAVGLPVFSGFRGGIDVLLGPTGGFILGYLPCAGIVGLCCGRGHNRRINGLLGMLAGTAVLYTLGTLRFAAYSGTDFVSAALLCVVPFLPGDAVKLILALLQADPLRKALEKPSKA